MKKYISTLLIIALLSPFLIPLSVAAAPPEPDGTHAVSDDSVLSPDADDMEELYECMDSADAAWNEYMFDLAQDAQILATWTLENPDVVAASILYDWLPSGSFEALPMAAQDWVNNKKLSAADIENYSVDQVEDYSTWLNDNFIFTLDSKSGEIVAQIKDSAKDISKTISDAVIDINRNNMILYQTQSIDDIDKFLMWDEYSYNGQWFDYTSSNVTNLITSNFSDDDYPLYFERSTSTIGILSLSNISNEFDCDGFVCNYNWSAFLERFSAFQSNGYLNNLNGQELSAGFYVYGSSRLFDNQKDFKVLITGNILSQPFKAYAYAYSEYRPSMIRSQSCIISQDGSPMIFFKDSAAYLDFYSNKMMVPYDFKGQNVNYSDLLNNLDKSVLASADSLSEIYSLLNDSISQSIQDAADRLLNTNQWLKKIYNKVEDWKKEWNIRNVVSTLTDIVGAVDDLIDIQHEVARLMNNTITGPVVDNIESMVEDATLASTLKSRFPFCLPIALIGTVDYISSFEAKPITFSISSNALGVPINFDFDYEDIPGNQIATLIVRSFIFLLFAFGMYRLTLRIIDIGKD